VVNSNFVAILDLFNQKVIELNNLTFAEYVLNKKWSLTIKSNKRGSPKTKYQGPSNESIAAFLLTFRLFIQKNERISLVNIAKIYDELDLDNFIKKEFIKMRHNYNQYLDEKILIPFKKFEKSFTRRKLLYLIIYGDRAHTNPSKRKIITILKQERIKWEIAELIFFVKILAESLQIFNDIRVLNLKVLEILQG
jgi:hypothetical protein